MKKLILLCVVVGLLVGSLPALAGDGDVQFYAFKTISLSETFTYTENVAFTGTGLFLFNGEGWAKIQEQQELYSLYLEVDTANIEVRKQANILGGSYDRATGIANVNQSPGNLNNQANEVGLSLAQPGTPVGPGSAPGTFGGMYCEAQVVSVQYNGILYRPATDTRTAAMNTLLFSNNNLSDRIDSSFNGFSGIANVNQAAGYLNNQGNAVAIAGGIEKVVVKAASNVMLAQNNAFNNVTDGGTAAFPGNTTNDSIGNSFNNAFGVTNVNQAAGAMNNQKSAVAISFAGYSR